MRKWITVASLAGICTLGLAQEESVYAPPSPVPQNEGTNQGGIHFELDLAYLTDYVYRGVNYSAVDDPDEKSSSNSIANLHTDAKIQFDLGDRMPHPFVAISANISDADPVSRFQEFQTAVGADLWLQPVMFTLALQDYTYPEREDDESSEVYGKIQLNDSQLFHSDTPVISPYLLVAYDYDLNDGTYIETGISHDFVFEDWFLVVTPVARIAYTNGWQQQFVFTSDDGTGWQHYEVGFHAQYKLNSLLNVSKRWGEWYLSGQVMHTESLTSSTVGQTLNWGGVGIGFKY